MASAHQALRTFLILGVCLAGLFSAPAAADAAVDDKWLPEIERIIAEIARSHGIELVWENVERFGAPEIAFEAIRERDRPRFLSFLRVFQEEVGKYPADFFQPSGLTKIVLVNKLFKDKWPARGVYRMPQGYMYFDIYRDFRNRPAQRHGIHHEIYHMISRSLWIDPKILPDGWEMLNEPGFVYQQVGIWHSGKNKVNYFAPPKLGFATDYGMTSAEEDKAEIFACLMNERERRLIETWGTKDPVLARKIEVMKQIVRQYSPSWTIFD